MEPSLVFCAKQKETDKNQKLDDENRGRVLDNMISKQQNQINSYNSLK